MIERRAELEREEDGREAGDLGEAQSLIAILASVPEGERGDLRRRLKDRIRQLVEGGSVVIVRRGKTALCALQFRFRGGDRRRDYLILHKPGTRYTQGGWGACSLPSAVAPKSLDLRRKRDAQELAKLLAGIDLDLLASAMRER